MNLSELARRLNVSPNHLRDTLPKIGFDVGRRAIKVDDRVAQKIVENWSRLVKELQEQAVRDKQAAIEQAIAAAPKIVELPEYVTVRELAQTLHLSLPLLMTELMKNGILSSVNERLDFSTASIIAEDLGYNVTPSSAEGSGKGTTSVAEKLKIAFSQAKELKPRPPVVVVMGHVDHGKTKLLDAIRHTNVVEKEAGGITQHIGAYQVEKQGKLITFIDTPGHEAFRAMRSRGAKVADIAILVVAADDGVKPQTKEALNIIQSAGLPFIVAVNKVDKPEANIEKVKQEFGAMGLASEDWGGKTIMVPLSAKTGEGIDHLLEMVLLVAEVQHDSIVADPTAHGLGTVIEAHVDPGEGPVATLLVQNGTLHAGDIIVHEDILLGRARLLKNYRGESAKTVGPSTPVRILGLKAAPEVGDILEVGDPKNNYRAVEKKRQVRRSAAAELAPSNAEESNEAVRITLPILIKADVLGSLEAIIESIAKLNHPEVGVQVVSRGLGNVTEADVLRAEAAQAFVAAFHVQVPREVDELAREKGVIIQTYKVIYDLLDTLKSRLSALLVPEVIHTDLGQGTVVAIFRQEQKQQIVGVRVIEGLARAAAKVKFVRQGVVTGEGIIERLQSGKESITEAAAGAECGVQLATTTKLMPGDVLQFYTEEVRARQLT